MSDQRRFFPPIAYADETHVHTDAELRSGIDEIVRLHAIAEAKRREAWVRTAIAAKVREAMEIGHIGRNAHPIDNPCHVDWTAAADAAVGVFVELLRDPPTIEHHPDGTEKIRWPRGAGPTSELFPWLTPEIEQHLADMPPSHWRSLTARVRPPDDQDGQ